MIKFTNMTTPASFGVEWAAGDNGSQFQLVNPRGTASLLFGCKPKGKGWMTTPVVDPSRFMEQAPKTFAEFERIARAYVDA